MESASGSNLVIISNKIRLRLFCKIYWRSIILITTPIILIPVLCIGKNNAYCCFYIFLLTAVYWVADVIHPCAVAMVIVAMSTLMGFFNADFVIQFAARSYLLNCFGMMMIIVVIERSMIHRRAAIKLLLLFGCSHYRLSFLIFFTTMFMSMWMSDVIACGFMMPLVKGILNELERMGILEVFQVIGKARQTSNRHESNSPRPTDFTVFYFLGIAYSSSIGGMGTMIGNETNNIMRVYADILLPNSPKIEFPHFMLLNLPGVILIELLLYLWMNSYFLGMFRGQSEIALEIGISEEESQFIKTLLVAEYERLGDITSPEKVAGVVCLALVLVKIVGSALVFNKTSSFTLISDYYSYFNMTSGPILIAVSLFFIPADLNFTKFFKRNLNEPLPSTTSKAVLNWNFVQKNVNWSVLFITGSSGCLFEAFKSSGMSHELGLFLQIFKDWPTLVLVFIVIVFFKVISEFANSVSVMYAMMPAVVEFTKQTNNHPYFLMMAATLASSTPYHLAVGSPVNAMVTAYAYIPPWKMMSTGTGPSLITVIVTWFTLTLWSKAVWNETSYEDINDGNKVL